MHAYDRLESGKGPGSPSFRKRAWAWRRWMIGGAAVVLLVWIGLSGRDRVGWSSSTDPTLEYEYHPAPPSAYEPHQPDYDTAPRPPTSPSSPRPTSHATDPDPSKTVHCTTPHTPNARLVQYALMIDAGSTGSRIHVYKFHNCGPAPTYEYETFAQRKPGLSAYSGKPAEAAASLDELMDVALSHVPKELHACTPVAVKATAGLRLLGAAESAAILAAVRQHLSDAYPFPVPDAEDAVSIMDGRDEGVYAWITANYLLDTVRGDSPADAQPYAVLDLGGASTQIVFEPKFASEVGLALGEHRYELDFGGKTRVLYQHSYLGYGLMRARAVVHRLVEFTNSVRVRPDPVDSGVGNPCLGRGMRRKVLVQDERDGWSANVSMVGADVGSFEACERVVQLVMAKDAVCALKPCSFDGVYQPSLLDTFPSGPVLLLSYFYDRLAPLLPTQTLSSPFPISTIASLARAVCAGPESWDKPGGDGGLLKDLSRDVREELRGRPEYCLDLTFMYELLRLGYEFGEDRLVRVGKQVEGTELGWALGAAIALVGGELRCKA